MPNSYRALADVLADPGASILCLDTCFGACSVAVGHPAPTHDGTTHLVYEERTTGHAEAIMPMLTRVLAEASLRPTDLDLVVATHGPGTFTGVRAGVAAARGLALALGIPAVGVSSLAAMAVLAMRQLADRGQTHGSDPATTGTILLVAMPAGRDQFYVEAFGHCHDARFSDGPMLLTDVAAAALRAPLPIIAVGASAARIAEAAHLAGREAHVLLEQLQPSAASVLRLLVTPGAWGRVHGSAPPPTVNHSRPITPLYLRAPDAKPAAPGLARRPP